MMRHVLTRDDGMGGRKQAGMASAILTLFLLSFLWGAPTVAQTPPSSGVSAQGATPQPVAQEHTEAQGATRDDKAQKEPMIALVLPVRSSVYSSAALAVKSGFMAAAEAAQAKDWVTVIEHSQGSEEVISAFKQATDAGAAVIVGPLVRDDLKALLAKPPTAWTITLTQIDEEGLKQPLNFFPLTLSVESDARLLAREIFIAEPEGKPVVVSDETPLMRRFSDAFSDEWSRLGKGIPERVRFSVDSLNVLKTRLEESSPTAVLLAVEGNDAVLARTQTRAWPTYASGHIYQRQDQFGSAALDGLHVVEIPWLITPQATRFKNLYPLPTSPTTARLYALGYDAFQTALSFMEGPPTMMTHEGATGHIRFSLREGLTRTGQIAVFENSRLQLLDEALLP